MVSVADKGLNEMLNEMFRDMENPKEADNKDDENYDPTAWIDKIDINAKKIDEELKKKKEKLLRLTFSKCLIINKLIQCYTICFLKDNNNYNDALRFTYNLYSMISMHIYNEEKQFDKNVFQDAAKRANYMNYRINEIVKELSGYIDSVSNDDTFSEFSDVEKLVNLVYDTINKRLKKK